MFTDVKNIKCLIVYLIICLLYVSYNLQNIISNGRGYVCIFFIIVFLALVTVPGI